MEKLNSIFFYHLERAIKTYRQYAQAQLKKKGFDITIDQWMVLKALTENPDITQNDLSDLVLKDKASVTRIIDLLVAARYLKRGKHESGRRKKLMVTEKGQKLLKEIVPTVLKNRRNALKRIGEKDIAVAEEVLVAIADNCRPV